MYVDKKFEQDEVMEMLNPLRLDLQAYYKVLEEAIILQLENAIKNNMSPDDAIKEIEKMFDVEADNEGN